MARPPTPPAPIGEQFIPMKSAARLLGVHHSTIRRWVEENKISSYRAPGGHYRFKPSEVIGLMKRREFA